MDDEQAVHEPVKRDGWPAGPWDDEPDRVEFRTRAGYPALIVRTESGHLCGYVAVPPRHPAYERSWTSEDSYERGADGELDYERPKPNPVRGLDCHGGITYAEKCGGKVCHVPAPGEPADVWWLGFDHAHYLDLSPGSMASARRLGLTPALYQGATYKVVQYVRNGCESLAEQLKALEVST